MRPCSGRDFDGRNSRTSLSTRSSSTWADRPRPAELLEPGADDTTRRLEVAIDQQTHGHGRRVPATGRLSPEDGACRRHFLLMKGLGIEFRGEALDACFFDTHATRAV